MNVAFLHLIIFIIVVVAIFLFSTFIYRTFNHGLSRSACHQQATRMAVASVLAMLPWAIVGKFAFCWAFIVAVVVSLLTMLTYPVIYHIAHRRTSPDYDNYMDTTFGLYLLGVSGALILLAPALPGGTVLTVVLGLIETVFMAIALAQIGYYVLYRNSVDSTSVEVVLSTGLNEVLEFMRYYNFFVVRGAILLALGLVAFIFIVNFSDGSPIGLTTVQTVGLAVYSVAMLFMMFGGKRSPWRRLGLISLVNEVRGFRKETSRYKDNALSRISSLEIKELTGRSKKPSTVVLVIGESANRDFMSAFSSLDRQTTPWLESKLGDEGMILFPNSYSCAIQTVPAVRMMVTEANQYNDVDFSRACSIIDVAHKLGMRVHWYSNQGHLGTFDTPVSLIAETADVAKWTHQEINKPQFDETLVDFLDEVDPTVDNLVVIHLKGSHFNYLNRFPKNRTVWSTPDMRDDVVNYMNSIRYTDAVLGMIHDYASSRLNLEAMVYVSDHGENPRKRRTPRFDGFENTRIPLFVLLSEDYIRRHPERLRILKENASKYFTNDLIYELLCSILDIESPRFNVAGSIGYREYKYDRDTLLTYEGRVRIADDKI